jgi:hypothetical protein
MLTLIHGLSLSALVSPLTTPHAPPAPRAALASCTMSSGSPVPTPRSRRDLLSAAGATALLAAIARPPPAAASYALYQASQTTFQERKATGYVPVATDDRASLAEIQDGIAARRPQYNRVKAKKPPQYCAGQTASVSPFLENICAEIGVSKADQSNTMVDSFGNMNIGLYTEADRQKYLNSVSSTFK